MDFDSDKVDDATLALLFLVMEKNKYRTRAWKGFDWDTMNRLYEKGFISDPKGKAKSVVVTDEGENEPKSFLIKCSVFPDNYGGAASGVNLGRP